MIARPIVRQGRSSSTTVLKHLAAHVRQEGRHRRDQGECPVVRAAGPAAQRGHHQQRAEQQDHPLGGVPDEPLHRLWAAGGDVDDVAVPLGADLRNVRAAVVDHASPHFTFIPCSPWGHPRNAAEGIASCRRSRWSLRPSSRDSHSRLCLAVRRTSTSTGGLVQTGSATDQPRPPPPADGRDLADPAYRGRPGPARRDRVDLRVGQRLGRLAWRPRRGCARAGCRAATSTASTSGAS